MNIYANPKFNYVCHSTENKRDINNAIYVIEKTANNGVLTYNKFKNYSLI